MEGGRLKGGRLIEVLLYVKIFFLELKAIIAGKRINLSVARTENCPNWEARCSKTTKRNKICYDPYIK